MFENFLNCHFSLFLYLKWKQFMNINQFGLLKLCAYFAIGQMSL